MHIVDIGYIVLLALVCLWIIFETRSAIKALAYLMLVIFVPIGGMIFYFSFGINYRKRRKYNRKSYENDLFRKALETGTILGDQAGETLPADELIGGEGLVRLVLHDNYSPLTLGNEVKILINGEEKFPELINALREARHHIHIQYYIFENDDIGRLIKEILVEKARAGVEVRLIYDDFGSQSIRRNLVREMIAAGVEAYPFNKIYLLLLANRLNYRNHRKIVVIDGHIAFTGGINIGDRYLNTKENASKFWRDTHLKIVGPGSHYLQVVFLCDWNFCSGKKVAPSPVYFNPAHERSGHVAVQIAASGPDSPSSTILLSMLKALQLARKQILITTPYFIPDETVFQALKVAALSGVAVNILVPFRSDSKLVDAAARSYYSELLDSGVFIYLYRKGFIHAKTLIVDDFLVMVGTANMDYRSFDLNFEVNAIIYNYETTRSLIEIFKSDLQDSVPIDPLLWDNRPRIKQLPERIARLVSPLL